MEAETEMTWTKLCERLAELIIKREWDCRDCPFRHRLESGDAEGVSGRRND